MSFFALSALTNAIISTLLGFFVFWKNKRERLNQTFSIFCFSTAFWSYAYYLWQISNDNITAYFWCRILMLGAIFITITYLHFTFVLLHREKRKKTFLIFSYLLFFSFFLLNIFTNKIVSHVEPLLVFKFWPIAGSLFFIFLFFWVSYALYAAVLLFNYVKQTSGQEKRKIGYILLGTIIGYGGGITNYFLWYYIPILPVGNISTSFYLAIVAYAIVKYELINIKVVATQVLAWGLVVITMLEVFNVKNLNDFIYKIIVLVVTLFFAIFLIRSVLKEVSRREQMERLARQLSEANKKRARINKQLEKANKQLKKLDEAKSEFISIASHQLRTPLTAIKGYGSMLLEGDFGEIKDSKHKDAIEKMFISNNRLISLVENLLNISRIESGRLRFDFKDQQLEALVEDVFNNFQQSAKNAGLFLKLKKLGKPLSPVYMDDEKIRQVVLNFIDNAIKYTRKGGIVVHLYEEDKQVFCKVEDTGMGVNKEDQKKLFQKFARGKDAFLVNTEGSGLGLYVAQMMIASHKGNIWVESEGMGKGSNFCFSLPVANSVTAKQLKNEQNRQKAKDKEDDGIIKKDKPNKRS